jgi:hypothetical protein
VFEATESSYFKAQKKVEEIKSFYGHLSSYILVNIGLTIINLITSPGSLWFIYPALGWGVGLAVHGMSVFNFLPFLGKDWEDRKIRHNMEQEQNKWK